MNDILSFILNESFLKALMIILLVLVAVAFLKTEAQKNKKVNLTKKKQVNTDLKAINPDQDSEESGISFGISKDKKKHTIISLFQSEGHTLAVGGSGLGKTSALLLPTLLSWIKSKGTVLCWDISGDIHPKIDSPKMLKYEPTNPDSTPYNVFGLVDQMTSKIKKNKALAKLALLLLPDEPGASEASRYYTREGRKIMTAALIAYYYQGLDFIEICEKINFLSWKNLLNEIDATGNEDAIKYINSFEGIPDQYSASAKQSCEDAINLFAVDEDIKKTIRRPKDSEEAIDPSKLETNDIFIVMDDSDLELYSNLSQIIASQCLDFIAKRPLAHTNPILICMDEAASLGQIDILPPLRKFRKRHTRIFMLTQSVADIDLTWGEKQRKAMMTNFKYKIVLECSEPTEQQYWSSLAGKEWIWHSSSKTKSYQSSSSTDNLTHENRIEPEDFANLGDDLILFYPGGYERLEKDYYFKHKKGEII